MRWNINRIGFQVETFDVCSPLEPPSVLIGAIYFWTVLFIHRRGYMFFGHRTFPPPRVNTLYIYGTRVFITGCNLPNTAVENLAYLFSCLGPYFFWHFIARNAWMYKWKKPFWNCRCVVFIFCNFFDSIIWSIKLFLSFYRDVQNFFRL